MFQKRVSQLLLLIIGSVLLSACNVELYTDLSEKEGNEILSILLQHSITSSKETNIKKKRVTVFVEETELSEAVKVLNKYGLPRESFDSVGEVFKKDGMISSPLEERARYIYALSQEISETLSLLDGVISARVHIVIPEPNPRLRVVKMPSTASVFIKHNDMVQLDVLNPQIKLLVSNSIEGLIYDNVSVVLFPSYTVVVDLESIGKQQWTVASIFAGIILPIFFIVLLMLAGIWWMTNKSTTIESTLSESSVPAEKAA